MKTLKTIRTSTAMERAAERKPETQYGDVITPATPPDWKEVDALASSLIGAHEGSSRSGASGRGPPEPVRTAGVR